MGGTPTVPPEPSGDDDDFDDFDDDDFDPDDFPVRHMTDKSDRPLKKLRRHDERPGSRQKRDGHPARTSKRDQRWGDD